MGAITNHSPAEEKVALFGALFRGREDVYPRRFESASTGRSATWFCDFSPRMCASGSMTFWTPFCGRCSTSARGCRRDRRSGKRPLITLLWSA